MSLVELLTPREKKILQLASTGLTDKEISSQLYVSRGTLITHWARMKAKLQSANRGEMIAHLIRHEMTAQRQDDALLGGSWCKSVLGNLPDVIVVTDENLVIRFVNEQYEKATKVKGEKIIGRPLTDVSQDIPFSKLWTCHIREVLETGGPATDYIEHRTRHANLTLEVVSIKTTCAMGQPVVISTVRETSNRKSTINAEIIAAALEGPDLVVIFNALGKVLYANEAVRQLLCFGICDLHPLGLDKIFNAHSIQQIEGIVVPETNRDGSWVGCLSLQGNDGSEYPIRATFVAHRDSDFRVCQMTMLGRLHGSSVR